MLIISYMIFNARHFSVFLIYCICLVYRYFKIFDQYGSNKIYQATRLNSFGFDRVVKNEEELWRGGGSKKHEQKRMRQVGNWQVLRR
jgi:hypothetical protein